MPKPFKYPKKFRQTLERIATERDARQALDSIDENTNDFHTFYRSFLPKASVHVMFARIDDVLKRVTSTAHMFPTTVDRVSVEPPWRTAEPAASD